MVLRVVRKHRESGFTIMELAAVLGIIAVLTTLSVPTYNALRRRAFEAEARTFIQEIRVACWVYRLENGAWPQDLDDIGLPSNYSSKYFQYQIGSSSTPGNLKITATGIVGGAAEGITVTGELGPDGDITITATTS